MKKIPTKFDGYYVSEDGSIWTEWYRNPPMRGELRKMSQNPRGGLKETEGRKFEMGE